VKLTLTKHLKAARPVSVIDDKLEQLLLISAAVQTLQ